MAEKALELQRQMRVQAQQAHDYFADLARWEDDIRVKDKALLGAKQVAKDLPPVRGTTAPAAPAGSRKRSKPAPPPAAEERLRGSDWRGWDKFDVDKELARLDSDEEGADAGPDEAADEALRERKLMEHMALREKDRGNAFFREGKIEAAVGCYSKGIELDPGNHILHANRAIGHIKMKRFKEAEADCNVALRGNPKYIKALSRRGTARAGLGDYARGLEDFEAVLKLEPKNKQARTEAAKLSKLLKRQQDEQYKRFNPLLASQSGRAGGGSSKPMRRVPIEEIGEAPLPDSPAKASAAPLTASPGIEEVVVQATAEAAAGEIPAALSPQPKPQPRQQSQPQPEPLPQADRPAAAPAPTTAKDEPALQVSVPTTSLEFVRLWKDARVRGGLLEAVAPARLPHLLGQNLDGTMLFDICVALEGLLQRDAPSLRQQALAILHVLPRVPRFDMALMFLDEAELEALARVFADATAASQGAEGNGADGLAALAAKFNISL